MTKICSECRHVRAADHAPTPPWRGRVYGYCAAHELHLCDRLDGERPFCDRYQSMVDYLLSLADKPSITWHNCVARHTDVCGGSGDDQ